MKFLNKVLITLMTVVTLFGVTACDEDAETAYKLSGSWSGDFGMVYKQNGKVFSAISNLELIPSGEYAKHGTGYQYDNYGDVYEPVTCYYRICWEVRDGVVNIQYADRSGRRRDLDACIYEYSLKNDIFTGYVGESRHQFRMRKIASFYPKYHSYYDGWGYSSYDDWGHYYYAAPRTDTRSAQQGDSVKVFNRFMHPELMEGKTLK